MLLTTQWEADPAAWVRGQVTLTGQPDALPGDDYHHNPYNIYDGPESAQSRVEADHFIEVSLLPQGVFANYVLERQAEGADLGHLKPSHINPSDKVLSRLSVEAVSSAEPVAAAR